MNWILNLWAKVKPIWEKIAHAETVVSVATFLYRIVTNPILLGIVLGALVALWAVLTSEAGPYVAALALFVFVQVISLTNQLTLRRQLGAVSTVGATTAEQKESADKEDEPSEVDSIIERLDAESVTFHGVTLGVSEILKRAGGELASGFDDNRPTNFFKALQAEPRAGDPHPEYEIRQAMNSLLMEEVVTREVHDVEDGYGRVRYQTNTYRLTPRGTSVLHELRRRALGP